jgi:hypothetical protein
MGQAFSECEAKMIATEKVLGTLIRSTRND